METFLPKWCEPVNGRRCPSGEQYVTNASARQFSTRPAVPVYCLATPAEILLFSAIPAHPRPGTRPHPTARSSPAAASRPAARLPADSASCYATKTRWIIIEIFSSRVCRADPQNMGGPGELPGAPPGAPWAAAQLAENPQGLELGVRVSPGARSLAWPDWRPAVAAAFSALCAGSSRTPIPAGPLSARVTRPAASSLASMPQVHSASLSSTEPGRSRAPTGPHRPGWR
jgi:hypothetical protein